MIKSITFDVARTLMNYSSDKDYYRAVSEFLVDHDLGLYPQEIRAAREYVFMVDLGKLGIDNWYDWTKQILYRLNCNNVPDEIINGVTAILKEATDYYVLYEDVIPVFKQLDVLDLTYSCLTTIPEFKLRKVFQPIRSKLHHIVHGGNAGCAKGNPKMYRLDLEWKRVKADENLFVGDDHLYDIEYPAKLGMTTVNIEREGKPQENQFSSYQIKNLHELLPIIDELLK